MRYVVRDSIVKVREGDKPLFRPEGTPQINGYAILPMEVWLDRDNYLPLEERRFTLLRELGTFVPQAKFKDPAGFILNCYTRLRLDELVAEDLIELNQFVIEPIEVFCELPHFNPNDPGPIMHYFTATPTSFPKFNVSSTTPSKGKYGYKWP